MSTLALPTPRPFGTTTTTTTTRKPTTSLTINTTLAPPSSSSSAATTSIKSPLSPAMIYSPVASPRDKDSAVQALLQTYDDVTFDFSPSSTTTFPAGSFAARNSRNSVSGASSNTNNTTKPATAEAAVTVPETPTSSSLRVSWYNLVTGSVTDEVHSIAFHPRPDNESDIQEVRDWCVEQASSPNTTHGLVSEKKEGTGMAMDKSQQQQQQQQHQQQQQQEIFRFEYGKYSSSQERKNLKVIQSP